jgi:beta-aspartyl-peptidase (threonine type)
VKYNQPVLLVHGGAGSWEEREQDVVLREIKRALEYGYDFFSKGSAIEAVVESIAYMEDSGYFDAGKGSYKNALGEVEMDAGIMHGNAMRVGAVASVKVKNPIREALKVMLDGRHVLMTEKVEEALAIGKSLHDGDTVGAVALDKDGNLVAGTSTGGINGKLPGRIGDSPIPGAGYYATNNVAVSSTGIGEIILRVLPAKEVDILVSMGFAVEDSVRSVVNKVTELFGKGNLGMIAIDKRGHAAAFFNTKGMPRGIKYPGGEKILLFEGEI